MTAVRISVPGRASALFAFVLVALVLGATVSPARAGSLAQQSGAPAEACLRGVTEEGRARCGSPPRIALFLEPEPRGERLRLTVRPNASRLRIASVRLRLPGALHFRQAFLRGVRECEALCGFGGHDRGARRAWATRNAITVRSAAARRVMLEFFQRALGRVRGAHPSQPREFQVTVRYEGESRGYSRSLWRSLDGSPAR